MRTLALIIALPACGDDGISAFLDWSGTYDARGTWDLSGPLGGERTVGDAVAAAVVDQMLGVLGVPGPLYDRAYTAVSNAVADDIAALVDANAPADLAPNSALSRALAATLATIEFESTITLIDATGPGLFEGKEEITTLAYTHDTTRYSISPSELTGGLVTIDAEWEARALTETLSVSDHVFGIRYGELVRRIAQLIMDATGLDQLATQAAAAIECPNVVNAILGGNTSFSLDIDGFSGGVDGPELTDICGAVQDLVGDKVMGLFSALDVVEIGGEVTGTHSSRKVIGMTSASGYGGTVNVLPSPIAPRLACSFTATHR